MFLTRMVAQERKFVVCVGHIKPRLHKANKLLTMLLL